MILSLSAFSWFLILERERITATETRGADDDDDGNQRKGMERIASRRRRRREGEQQIGTEGGRKEEREFSANIELNGRMLEGRRRKIRKGRVRVKRGGKREKVNGKSTEGGRSRRLLPLLIRRGRRREIQRRSVEGEEQTRPEILFFFPPLFFFNTNLLFILLPTSFPHSSGTSAVKYHFSALHLQHKTCCASNNKNYIIFLPLKKVDFKY